MATAHEIKYATRTLFPALAVECPTCNAPAGYSSAAWCRIVERDKDGPILSLDTGKPIAVRHARNLHAARINKAHFASAMPNPKAP